jgi:hypothetical protein
MSNLTFGEKKIWPVCGRGECKARIPRSALPLLGLRALSEELHLYNKTDAKAGIALVPAQDPSVYGGSFCFVLISVEKSKSSSGRYNRLWPRVRG